MFKVGQINGPKPKFRVYVALEQGDLLVRRAEVASLKKAVQRAAGFAEALYVEIRTFWGGKERLVNIEEIRL